MATLVKTPSVTWKAVIRRQGWASKIRTFRTKRDAEDRAYGPEKRRAATIKKYLGKYSRAALTAKTRTAIRARAEMSWHGLPESGISGSAAPEPAFKMA